MEAKPLKEVVDSAVKALNELIICEEFTDPRAVVKVSRFKKWLREQTADPTPQVEDNTSDELDLFSEQAQTSTDNKDNQPQIINFQND